MNAADLAIGVGAGVAGFAIVWWLISVFRQQKAPPVVIGPAPPAAAPRGTGHDLSVAEPGGAWHLILGVPPQASPAEIEVAYQARMAECDRVRFSADQTEADRQRAETRRRRLNEAFDFARSRSR